MTALTGGNISKESFAISTAILAAPYAAFQTDSLDDPGSLRSESVGSQDGEIIDRATALDEAASALRSFFRGLNVASPRLMYSAIGGGLSVGVPDDEDFFRKWRMVDVRQQRAHVQISQGVWRFVERHHLPLPKFVVRITKRLCEHDRKCTVGTSDADNE